MRITFAQRVEALKSDRAWAGARFHSDSVLAPEEQRFLTNVPSGWRHGAKPVPAGGLPPFSTRLGHNPVDLSSTMESLARGEDLSAATAAAVFSRLMDGELSLSQAGALLFGLHAKGETPDEISEAALAVLARAVPIPPVLDDCIDIAGTGGDGKSSFNCSTAASLMLAGMGHKAIKHGNRSVSSRCGSADVLEQLGLPLDTPPESVPRLLREEGFVFLFAPRYHPSFQHVMPVRRELGIRTLFNILGPLVNPARPTRHFLGVADPSQLALVAKALARVSSGSGAVVCGACGYDELTAMGEARILFVADGSVRPGKLDPAEYGFKPCTERELAVEGPEHAAAVLRELLQGKGPEAMREMLALNLAFALYLIQDGARRNSDKDCGHNRKLMAQAVRKARQAVAEGAGRRFCRA